MERRRKWNIWTYLANCFNIFATFIQLAHYMLYNQIDCDFIGSTTWYNNVTELTPRIIFQQKCYYIGVRQRIMVSYKFLEGVLLLKRRKFWSYVGAIYLSYAGLTNLLYWLRTSSSFRPRFEISLISRRANRMSLSVSTKTSSHY